MTDRRFSHDGSDEDETEAESDAEQAESEWHTWVAAMVLVAGGAILVAPDYLVPGLIRGLGPLFILLAILGWVIQWGYKRTS